MADLEPDARAAREQQRAGGDIVVYYDLQRVVFRAREGALNRRVAVMEKQIADQLTALEGLGALEAETAYQLLPDIGLIFHALPSRVRDAISDFVTNTLAA